MATIYQIGQVNAVILARFPGLCPAQATSSINDLKPHAQSQAYIRVTTIGVAQASADIFTQSRGFGQSTVAILAKTSKVAQTQAQIT